MGDRFRRTEFSCWSWPTLASALRQDFVLRRIGSILETEPDTVKSMMPEARAAAAVEDKPAELSPFNTTFSSTSELCRWSQSEMVEGPNALNSKCSTSRPNSSAKSTGSGASEAAAVVNSGLTSTPADRRQRRAKKMSFWPLAFAEGEPNLPWPESARGLKLKRAAGRFDASVAWGAFGATLSIVLDELRSQGQDDTALRHWIGQAEHMLRNEEPLRCSSNVRSKISIWSTNAKPINELIPKPKAAAAGDFFGLGCHSTPDSMG